MFTKKTKNESIKRRCSLFQFIYVLQWSIIILSFNLINLVCWNDKHRGKGKTTLQVSSLIILFNLAHELFGISSLRLF